MGLPLGADLQNCRSSPIRRGARTPPMKPAPLDPYSRKRNEVLAGGNPTRDLDRTWRWSCAYCQAAASCDAADRWTVIWLPGSDHMNNQKRIFYWCSPPHPCRRRSRLLSTRLWVPAAAPEKVKTNTAERNRWLSFQAGRKIPRDLWPPNRLAALTVGDLLRAVAGISVTQIWDEGKPISVLHDILSI